MRFGRRLKRTTKQYIIVALICIIVIGSAATSTSFIMIGQIREEYEFLLNESRQEINDNKKSLYIALSDIKAGEILSEDKVEKKLVYASQSIESYATKDELGKASMINIPKGSHIVKSMLAQNTVSSVLREVEYDVVYISSNIEANDYVDVRISYPNGESYVVLSKKSIKGFQPNTPICYLWVDEEELLRMSAAIVDAGLYGGSSLYMTKYIEPNIQDSSVITYTPSVSVLSLIENDPNIVDRCSQVLNKEVRKALENRLADSIGIDISTIAWKLDGDIKYMPENLLETDVSSEQEMASDTEITSEPKSDEKYFIGTEKDIQGNMSYGEEVYKETNIKDSGSINYFPELGRYDQGKYLLATEG